ncbi:beta-propeller fold lactonase family protein [Embleya hyalina]|uniref:Uncharacterized protein n=1 Tax=Embleya hyalina TaxID=516124 RepID=A0A401Z4M3_9ACTN|nr:beta-propeller fold lactonase family protein [Embleya hyalina]GCE01799.1 hypothetical protein EHYA_09573 [Embleya hyalina]
MAGPRIICTLDKAPRRQGEADYRRRRDTLALTDLSDSPGTPHGLYLGDHGHDPAFLAGAVTDGAYRVYVTCTGSAVVLAVRVDPNDGEPDVQTTVPVGANPAAVALSPRGDLLAVAEPDSRAVHFLSVDPTTGSMSVREPPLDIGCGARHLVFASAGPPDLVLAAAAPGDRRIVLITIDPANPQASLHTTTTVDIPGHEGPAWLGFDPEATAITALCPKPDFTDGVTAWLSVGPERPAAAGPPYTISPVGLDVRTSLPGQAPAVVLTLGPPLPERHPT